ncbi:DUF6781 family protein [Pseudorhodoferax sp. Leaf274]|uniref:DUF6781 family protein n=1 Tax=Pseudorhodoferax sp. Leaf274 TaxID=1736318 RepID=UPI0007028BD4|nr:DUF6781 family protein [Pseudorhodoferax sp. Leaf274]KQP35656.1 hypothetical protein ASF44_20255 [Pseudorhodoferax sp. Leaf274]
MIFKHGIDQAALVTQFTEASAKQGEAVRKAVHDATLKALQSRELTLANIRQVLGTVTKAASAGAAGSSLPAPDVEALLGKAFAGMDGALEQAVQASQRALQQMVDQGASLRETQLKKALADIEKMEDALFASVRKAAAGAGTTPTLPEGPWTPVLAKLQGQHTGTGARATAAVEQLMADTQKGLRDGRAMGLKASQAMLDSYATLVSGVLIGMSDALQKAPAPAAAKKTAKR